MLKIQQIFPKFTVAFFLLFFIIYNLKMQGPVDAIKDLNKERSKEFFVRENLKNKHLY